MTPLHRRPRLDVVVRQEITSKRLTFQPHLMRTPSAYGLRDPRHGTARRPRHRPLVRQSPELRVDPCQMGSCTLNSQDPAFNGDLG